MNRFRKTKLTQGSQPHTEILRMSNKKSLRTRRTLASAPAGILSLDPTVALRQKQARRPPAVTRSNRRRPVILLAEHRESTRVALKNALEAAGYDVIVVERASEALSIGAVYGGHIDFLITEVAFLGIKGGLLAHLFQCVHPETRALFLCGNPEEVFDLRRHAGSENPCSRATRLDVFASKVSEMINDRDSARYSTEAVTN